MKIEIRGTDEVRISGYVNAVERDSRVLPAVMSRAAPGPFVEKVSAGAFKRAIVRNPNIRLLFNHEREIGSVGGGSLTLREDNIGLYAEASIADAEVVAAARKGELRGWSFGFSGAQDKWEQYKEGIHRRTLADFELDEVSILTKTPAYVGTSVELRSAEESEQPGTREIRSCEDAAEVTEIPQTKQEKLPLNGHFLRKKQLELLKLKGEI